MEKKTLESLSIFELRDLARKVGVFNPTVLKKNELVSAICDIQSGKVKPYISKTKQGRPPKVIGGYDKLVEIFLPNDITEVQTREEVDFIKKEDNLVFHCDPDTNEDSSGQITYKGYLEELENGSGLLRPRTIRGNNQKDFVYVPNRFMINLKLKRGDEIVCKANVVRNDRALVLVDVLEINDVPLKDYSLERNDFKSMPCDLSAKPIELKFENQDKCNLKINYGDTIFTYSNKADEFYQFSTSFIQNNRQNFDHIIYLCPMLTSQSYERLKSLPVEVYSADFESNLSTQQKTSFLAFNRARRLAETGNNVLFVVDNVTSLMGLEKDLFGDMTISKTILATAKCFTRGSLTVMASVPPLHHKNITNIFYSTFPVIETVGLVLKDNKVDFKESYRK